MERQCETIQRSKSTPSRLTQTSQCSRGEEGSHRTITRRTRELTLRTKEKEILIYKPRGFELSALKGLVKFIGCGKQAGAGHQPGKKQSTVATRQGTFIKGNIKGLRSGERVGMT